MPSNSSIMGVMIESNLVEGKQPLQKDLKYGISITDSCIGFSETQILISECYEKLHY
jgi:3-deoxy-7-phosphoheptulonate synthase